MHESSATDKITHQAADPRQVDDILQGIRDDQQKIINNEGEIVLSLVSIGSMLNQLEALSGGADRLQLYHLGYNPGTAAKLRKLGLAWGDYYEPVAPDLLPSLPLDLDKLCWLCRLDEEKLRSFLSWFNPKSSTRKDLVGFVRRILGEKPPAARRVRASTALRTFDRLTDRLVRLARHVKADRKDDTARLGLTAGMARLRSTLETVVAYWPDDNTY